MIKKLEKSIDNQEAIKRLLILLLMQRGITSEVIGDVLGVDGSTIRRIVPQKNLKKQKSK